MEERVKALLQRFDSEQRDTAKVGAKMLGMAWNRMLTDLSTQRKQLVEELSKLLEESKPVDLASPEVIASDVNHEESIPVSDDVLIG